MKLEDLEAGDMFITNREIVLVIKDSDSDKKNFVIIDNHFCFTFSPEEIQEGAHSIWLEKIEGRKRMKIQKVYQKVTKE